MNINLLVTDLLPLVTLLYSYGYIKKTGAVTNGNKVKICILLPRKPRMTRVSAIGNKVTNDFCVFLYIYAFFLFGRITDRADTNKSHPKGNIGRLEEESREHPTSADNFQCYNSTMFTAWQKCHKIFLPLPPKQLKLTI